MSRTSSSNESKSGDNNYYTIFMMDNYPHCFKLSMVDANRLLSEARKLGVALPSGDKSNGGGFSTAQNQFHASPPIYDQSAGRGRGGGTGRQRGGGQGSSRHRAESESRERGFQQPRVPKVSKYLTYVPKYEQGLLMEMVLPLKNRVFDIPPTALEVIHHCYVLSHAQDEFRAPQLFETLVESGGIANGYTCPYDTHTMMMALSNTRIILEKRGVRPSVFPLCCIGNEMYEMVQMVLGNQVVPKMAPNRVDWGLVAKLAMDIQNKIVRMRHYVTLSDSVSFLVPIGPTTFIQVAVENGKPIVCKDTEGSFVSTFDMLQYDCETPAYCGLFDFYVAKTKRLEDVLTTLTKMEAISETTRRAPKPVAEFGFGSKEEKEERSFDWAEPSNGGKVEDKSKAAIFHFTEKPKVVVNVPSNPVLALYGSAMGDNGDSG